MTKEKHFEPRRRRSKDLGERFSRAKASEEEETKRRKAEEVIENIQETVKTIKEKKKITEYVPKLTSNIDNLLSSAENSYKLADYVKVFDLSLELQELIAKAEAESSKIIKDLKKKRREMRKYFYAIIPLSEKKSFGNIGMNNEEVYALPYKDIAAVVSDTPIKEYGLTEENLRKHESVLRRVMDEYTVVPAEFGTVINNERILKRLLNKAHQPTRECLKLVDNMVELGVKAIIKKDIVHFEKGHGKINSSEILNSLKKKAEQSVSGELFSDRLILNESFFVKKEEVDAFSEEVEQLEESYPMIKFLYSGPWAPYNFVYIKIGNEGIKFGKKR